MATRQKRIDPKAAKTRRLTRAEADKLGVKYSAKHRVRADLTRVTKRSTLYSERQWIEARAGVSRETLSLERRSKTAPLMKSERYSHSTHISNLSKKELSGVLKKQAKHKTVVLQLFGEPAREGARYGENKPVWITAGQHFADELFAALPDIEDEFGFDEENPPKRYGVVIYELKPEFKVKTSNRGK